MLIARIDRFLRQTRMPETRFGRDAVGDPNLVATLRRGRRPRLGTVHRIEAFIRARSAGGCRDGRPVFRK
jgi:hypothetical protein